MRFPLGREIYRRCGKRGLDLVAGRRPPACCSVPDRRRRPDCPLAAGIAGAVSASPRGTAWNRFYPLQVPHDAGLLSTTQGQLQPDDQRLTPCGRTSAVTQPG